MAIPQNLAGVINRVKPRAILLLDSNTIMDFPNLSSYRDRVAASGRFLLVIPRDVSDEILRLKHPKRKTRRKAAAALKAITNVYEKGDPESGIKLHDNLWVATVPSVLNSDDDQVRRFVNLVGDVDSALIRLTEACREVVPTILVTRDNGFTYIGLTHKAKEKGLPVCSLPDLRKAEEFNAMLVGDRRTPTLDPDASLRSLLSDEEKPMKIPLTLEELRSEGDYLIARGSGIITWHSDRYPFRWKFPYKNAEKIEDLEGWFPDDDMPLENLDFFGRDEQLPEPVRRRVCFRLEEQAKGRLQPPSIRAWIMFDMIVEHNNWLWEPEFLDRIETLDPQLLAEKSLEEREIIDKARQYAKLVRPLLNRTAKLSVGSYAEAFGAYKALAEQIGKEPVDENPMSGLASLWDSALDGWSVGSTIESETSQMERAIKILADVLDEEGELNGSEAVED